MRKPLERTESQVPADGDVGTSDQHTRGPWRTRSTGRDVVIEADDPAGVTAAPFQIGVVTCGDFTDATGAAKQINSANARLIAAAPSLLEALRLALAALEGKPCRQQAIDDGHAAIAATKRPAVMSAAVHAISEPAMPHVAAPTTEWFVYYRQQIASQSSELTRLQKIEAAALRVASSRRNRVVTDQGPLDALDAALESQS